ncbi:siphovirus Gp157 family protein [Aggregatibacter actinomycetemcomitans]|uniref:siphovirus Gp157 family protein n=1 Tax=Aggregatibacter actinomycetemcomitans TaxID=714 RepID=UPI00197C09A7|nr:siphovirus Gp157 family protein [Aggregatibacter actinomycetemcomitans]MBN6068867.1 siphovirus Gp157 family protein [Aggregatibacter actinomycetemcomitans]MBN6068953.1 siphovirus Gp157 family protein [Aggregatibacter actinomycetemcomitans]MBN6069019.1 siphovirus Gp157 family protein [Aggregatibacter actinomycetemcomitans]MBN6069501.1 siphovirus Gp157 family protein [Aggregatibacter actinomycetemcomitans]MBN6086862.1 siphovirus Gp157 family protein [Aggregatibacter actinomycetemcomitans]
MKLYDISEQYQNIAELLNNPEFAENEDVLAALDKIQDDFDHKVQQTVFILKNIESEIDPIDAEIKRLQAMKKSRQNNIDRIKERLKANLKATDTEKVNCGVFTVAYREQKESAVEIDEDLFLANNMNESFVSVKITPNKTEIKKALKDGAEIIGAKLVDSQVLTIR